MVCYPPTEDIQKVEDSGEREREIKQRLGIGSLGATRS